MRVFCLLLSGLWSSTVSAEPSISEQSAPAKMEAGVALVGQIAADYRGSSHYRPYGLPLPYFLYQGPIFKADRDGVRGDFWSSKRMEFNISVDGSLNGNSDDNEARRGMPELESAVEFGPSLNIHLAGPSLRDGWALRLPLRAVITISENGLDHIGNVFSPRLTWHRPQLMAGWRASAHIGATLADSDYHSYFYDVAERYVTENRPSYHAGGGYSGSFLRFSIYKPWQHWRVGVSVRYDYLQDAVFTNSPLIDTKHYCSVSVGFIRTLWRSDVD